MNHKKAVPLQPQSRQRAFSSAGLEHLPYKQRVGGSNPSTPTAIPKLQVSGFIFLGSSGIPSDDILLHDVSMSTSLPM